MTLSPAARATAGLGFTQIVGWGTTFLMPAVLGRHIQESLGLASEVVFAGITVMFGVGALLAPQVGRLIDRTGARKPALERLLQMRRRLRKPLGPLRLPSKSVEAMS